MDIKDRYDRIGKNYNRTRRADAYLTERLFFHLNPSKTGMYLDIGCGTGNYTISLNKKGVNFVGVDPSEEMLRGARSKSRVIEWKIGNAEDIPLDAESVNGILATLTIHHWQNLEKAFAELNRVLVPNAKAVTFTSTPNQMKGYWLNHYFPAMLKRSISRMPNFGTIEKALLKSGFEIIELEKYFVRNDLEDRFLYSGKHAPKIYLNEEFRNGISSFSDLSNSEEVELGLSNLETDIESGRINEMIKNYENDKGDYLFIVWRKIS